MKKIITILLFVFINTFSFANETSFKDVIIPYAEKTLKALEKGMDIAMEEIPIVVQQYIVYEAISSWLLVVFSILLLIIIPLSFKFTKKMQEPEKSLIVSLSTVLTLSVAIPVFVTHIDTAIKATFFPKLFLMETILNFI